MYRTLISDCWIANASQYGTRLQYFIRELARILKTWDMIYDILLHKNNQLVVIHFSVIFFFSYCSESKSSLWCHNYIGTSCQPVRGLCHRSRYVFNHITVCVVSMAINDKENWVQEANLQQMQKQKSVEIQIVIPQTLIISVKWWFWTNFLTTMNFGQYRLKFNPLYSSW